MWIQHTVVTFTAIIFYGEWCVIKTKEQSIHATVDELQLQYVDA